MKKLAIAAAVSSILLLQGCKPEVQFSEQPTLTVSTLTVDAPVQSQFRHFNGLVIPAEQTPLAFRLSGEVVQIGVKEGQSVKKGQLLAKLDDRKLSQQLAEAKTQYELARKQRSRAKELVSKGMVSQAEFDELTANLKLAKAQFEMQQKQMDYTELHAPFDGVISNVAVEQFEPAPQGTAVVTMYRNDKVYVQIQMSDTVLSMLNPDANKGAYLPNVTFSGYEQSHRMTYLEHTSEPSQQSKSYELWLTMDQVQPAILPGTSAVVDVDMKAAGLGTNAGYLLPMTVLQAGTTDGEFYVWKWQEGKAVRVPVGVDQVTGNGVLISTGVEQGDELVSSSLKKLREGQPVVKAEGKAL
ncbi:efflux RND transporter periplasmic adaptor subunit [Vibrio sp. SCSIO 43136]|uniref:efflux RND transporter periplasmic adaptor subunit n=1 Tax=Vibrio sp. SCSIO 43136 TaxID=2819101 RepID=UPI0020750D1F|nr:efflux RND transporter periplasmic adaptor subunit [Vibrio sp. SCSIO 43136]USD64019.1 efflux RND transporter periplasmic adaptor subunit [Vibrio sp. SCSIO 43136]